MMGRPLRIGPTIGRPPKISPSVFEGSGTATGVAITTDTKIRVVRVVKAFIVRC